MTGLASYREPAEPAFLFDLDGTLIDSVYQHVIAWRAALSRLDIDLSVWRIHRRIGMSGGLFVSALLRETGRTLSEADIAMLQRAHQEEYLAQADSVRPLPAAAALLGVEPRHAFVVGDSVWDLLAARRAGALGIGVLSGGYGREELERVGAYRVYADPADLLARADEVGVR